MTRVSNPKQALDYPQIHDDLWVIWWSNGKPWPDASRELKYLSQYQCETMQGWALFTLHWQDANTFTTQGDARRWLADQQALRPTPYGDLNVTTVAELKRRCGYSTEA